MVALSFDAFLGTAPIKHPTKLGPGQSVSATNCWFLNGTLRPLKQPLQVSAAGFPGTQKTLFYHRPDWQYPATAYRLDSNKDLSFVSSPVAQDAYGRVFWTTNDGSDVPRFTDYAALQADPIPRPQTSYKLGLPIPPQPAVKVAGNIGSLATSPDGVTWTQQTAGIGALSLQSVRRHSNNIWMVTGPDGVVATSSDAVTWTVQETGTTYKLYDSVYTGSLYVAVGAGGTILTSSDGATWTAQTSGTTRDLYTIAYADGVLWVGGAKGIVLKSTNGTAWTANSGAGSAGEIFNGGDVLSSVVRGLRVVLGGAGGILATKPNASTAWAAVKSGTGARITGLATNTAATAYFAYVTANGLYGITTNPDAAWTQRHSTTLDGIIGAGTRLNSAAFGADNSLIVVAANGKMAHMTALAADNSWVERGDFGSNNLHGVTYAGGKWAVAGEVGTGTPDTRFYVVTLVDHYGSEGPSSPVSEELTVLPDQPVVVTLAPLADATGYNLSGAKWRVYRTATGTSTTEFLFVAEVAYSGTSITYTDQVKTSALGEVLPSQDWLPPSATLKGLVALPGGVLAGFTGNTIWFSEPGQPHAWPYHKSVEFPIVGLGVFGNSVFIGTTGQSYIADGVDPANTAVSKVDAPYSCVSRRSIVSFGDRVVYASPAGLVAVSAQGAELLTRNLMTHDQWQALKPSSIQAFFWEGQYLAFYAPDSGPAASFVFMPGDPDVGISYSALSADCGFYDPYDNVVYIVNGAYVYQWNKDTATLLTATWKSGILETAPYTCFSFWTVQADAYPVTAKYYIWAVNPTTKQLEPTLVQSFDFQDNNAVRLPAGHREQYHQLELSSANAVFSAHMTQSAKELREL